MCLLNAMLVSNFLGPSRGLGRSHLSSNGLCQVWSQANDRLFRTRREELASPQTAGLSSPPLSVLPITDGCPSEMSPRP